MTNPPAWVASEACAQGRRTHRRVLMACAAVLAIYLVLGSMTVWMCRLTGDEGWYTLAALQLLQGRMLYRDFLFTQPPAMPHLYAGWLALTGPSLVAARTLSCVLGFATVALTMSAAQRKAGYLAALIAGLLLVGNLSFMFDVCSVKTQALTVCLSALSLWATSHERTHWGLPLALLAAAALVLTRLSMLPVLAMLGVYAWQTGVRPAWIAGAFTLVVVTLLRYPLQNLWFGMVDFHSAWYGDPHWRFDRFCSVLNGFMGNQWPIMLAATSAAGLWFGRQRIGSGFSADLARRIPWLGLLLACYALTSAIHLFRAVAYPIHQTSNIVFVVMFAACIWARFLEHRPRARRLSFALLGLTLALGWRTQEYVVHADGAGGLGKLAEVSQLLRNIAPARGLLWTLSSELAVETGLPLLPGWELSEFSWFPQLSETRARALHVTNRAMLLRDLSAARPTLICLTQRHLRLLGPLVESEIVARYRLHASFERYGQFFEPLLVFIRDER